MRVGNGRFGVFVGRVAGGHGFVYIRRPLFDILLRGRTRVVGGRVRVQPCSHETLHVGVVAAPAKRAPSTRHWACLRSPRIKRGVRRGTTSPVVHLAPRQNDLFDVYSRSLTLIKITASRFTSLTLCLAPFLLSLPFSPSFSLPFFLTLYILLSLLLSLFFSLYFYLLLPPFLLCISLFSYLSICLYLSIYPYLSVSRHLSISLHPNLSPSPDPSIFRLFLPSSVFLPSSRLFSSFGFPFVEDSRRGWAEKLPSGVQRERKTKFRFLTPLLTAQLKAILARSS